MTPHTLAQVATHAIAEGGSHKAGPPKVAGMGSCGLDYLAAVAAFPKPDEKLRTTALEVPAARRPSLTCALQTQQLRQHCRLSRATTATLATCHQTSGYEWLSVSVLTRAYVHQLQSHVITCSVFCV